MITDDIADAREQTRWFPAMVSNHVKDLIDRYGTDGSVVPKALTDYVEARKFYDYNEHSRVGAAHGAFVTDEICDRFSVLGNVEQATAKLRELESIGVDHYSIYLMTHSQEETLAAYGEHIIPAVQGRGGIDDAAAEQVEAWRSVAAGWERRRELFARATARALRADGRAARAPARASGSSSSRPAPARRVPRAAADPARAASCSRPMLRPRWSRRPAGAPPSSGSTSVEFAVEDAAGLTLPDASRRRRPLPLRADARPRHGARWPREIARVLRPGGRVGARRLGELAASTPG